MNSTTQLPPGFYGLGIAPKLLDILGKEGYREPTPIQQKSIPVAIEGKDLIGVAQTGTGKTLAFCIPMIQRLAQVKGRGLVILPTRELALQADEVYKQIGASVGLRSAVLIGGASQHMQERELKKKPHVIIATPGRLNDMLQQKVVALRDVRVLVLDEADRMLDMGFLPQIQRILEAVPKDRQTMLFSATMPDSILKIAAKHMKLPVQVEIARSGTTAEGVVQELFIIAKDAKPRLLDRLLGENRGSVLVFTRTKHGAKKVARLVRQMGHASAEIHSNRSLAQRRDALEGFKSGKYRVLVATDVASRGIDVKGIEIVINYDLPSNPEDYVHRIGRTARAGQAGRAISFATPDQRQDIRDIERLIRKPLTVSKQPELPEARPFIREEKRTSEGSRQQFKDRRQKRSDSAGRSHSSSRRHSGSGSEASGRRRSGSGPTRYSKQGKRPSGARKPRVHF